MKKLSVILFACFLSAFAFADSETISVTQMMEECKKLQINIDRLKKYSIDIKNAQIEKLRENKGIEYKVDELENLNDNILSESSEILNELQTYTSEATLEYALSALNKVKQIIQDYNESNFENNEIKVSDSFLQKLHELNNSLAQIRNLEINSIRYDVTISENEKKREEYIQFVYIGISVILSLVIITLLCVLVLLIKLKKRVKIHANILNDKADKSIEIKLKKLEEQIYTSTRGFVTKKKDRNEYRTYQPSYSEDVLLKCQSLIENLRIDLLKEISSIKDQISSVPVSQSNTEGGSAHIEKSETTGGDVTLTERSTESEKQKSNKARKIFGQLQNNGTFKVYDDDKRTAFFVIYLDSSDANTASFELKELSVEDMQSAIGNRTTLLTPGCEIESVSASPTKIKLNKPGIARKEGNEWRVSDKAKISLL